MSVDTSVGRTEYLTNRLSELVTEHGPKHLTPAMGRNEAFEAILECVEALLERRERLEVQLAGCLTAAEGWGVKLEVNAYGSSPAYQAVKKLRDEVDVLRSHRGELNGLP